MARAAKPIVTTPSLAEIAAMTVATAAHAPTRKGSSCP
jgi:hypothetical protein